MNIMRRTLLQQITLKREITKNICGVHRFQIHTFPHDRRLLNQQNTTHRQLIDSDRNKSVEYSIHRNSSTKSWLQNLITPFKSSKSVLAGKGVLLYAHGVDTINYADFIVKFKLPNTFNSWFLVTEIHVWMLMVRAMSEVEHGQLIRNGIVAELWRDAYGRATKLAAGSIMKKQLIEMSEQFQYAIVAYDEGLMKDDKTLASALWTRFFGTDCDNYEHLELLVKYIRCCICDLDNINTDEFLTKRKIKWPSLSEIEKQIV